MSAPSANTRASRNVRSTASQPLIEKPTSMERISRSRNALGDYADHDAEKVQREQHPGDRPQAGRVRGNDPRSLFIPYLDRIPIGGEHPL